MKESQIVRELKLLYRRDPKIAKRTAKVLGYKIVAKKEVKAQSPLVDTFTNLANLVGGMSRPKSALDDILAQLEALSPARAKTLEKILSAAYKALYKFSATSSK